MGKNYAKKYSRINLNFPQVFSHASYISRYMLDLYFIKFINLLVLFRSASPFLLVYFLFLANVQKYRLQLLFSS